MNGTTSKEIKINEDMYDDKIIENIKEEDQVDHSIEEQAHKRVKIQNNEPILCENKNFISKSVLRSTESVCEICLQKLNDEDLRLYIGHPNNAVDEYSVLLDPKLCLFNGDELNIIEGDARALNKVTSFRYNRITYI
jgi:DNA (cytosine-5)-methyltransferase 1